MAKENIDTTDVIIRFHVRENKSTTMPAWNFNMHYYCTIPEDIFIIFTYKYVTRQVGE